MGRAHDRSRRRGVIAAVVPAVAALAALLLAPPALATHPVQRLTIRATPHGILTGGHATFTGRAGTARHRLLRLQVLGPGGWVNTGRTRTTARGHYLVADRDTRTGQFRVLAPRARVSGRTMPAVASTPVSVGMASDLESGQTLQPGQFLTSPGGAYVLTMRPDGVAALTAAADPASVVWSTGTPVTAADPGHPGARLVMQTSGDLVLVDPTGLLLWDTGTRDAGADLTLGDDGGVAVHDGTSVLWDRVGGVHVPAEPVGSSAAAVRGQSWVDVAVPYSQARYFANGFGRYRTDCSGFVSMMWGLSSSYTTRTIPSISTVITKDQLASGDVLNSPGRHVVLFDAWADAAHTQYWAYEETPATGATHRVVPYPYWKGSKPGTFVPRRLG